MYDELKTDCRQFKSDRPCAPHKRTGVTCPTCTEYDPVQTRVLVVKLAALGDVLRTTALLPAIHAAFPGCHVTWITAPGAVSLMRPQRPGRRDVVGPRRRDGGAAVGARASTSVLCPDADPEAAMLAAAAHGR